MNLKLNHEGYIRLSKTITRYTQAVRHACLVSKLYKIRGRKKLHAKVYSPLKLKYGLGSQLTCNAIADAYKIVNHKSYTPNSITFDKNTCTLHGNSIRLYTLGARVTADLVTDVTGIVSKAVLTLVGDNTAKCELQVIPNGQRSG